MNVAAGSTAIFTNCVIWGNVGGEPILVDPEASFEATYTVTDTDLPMPGEGNLNVAPRFESAATGDYHLEADSPCIDAGTSDSAPATDLEGRERACGMGVDIGAYEHCVPRFLRGDCDGDSEVTGSVTDAVFLLNYNFAGGAEPLCLAACDADGDGRVRGQVTDTVYLLNFNFLAGPPPPSPFRSAGKGRRRTSRSVA